MENHHPLADLIFADACTGGDNHTGRLVSENARRGVRTGGDLLQVGPANAAGVDPHQQLAGANCWNRNLLQPHVIHAAIHGRAHD